MFSNSGYNSQDGRKYANGGKFTVRRVPTGNGVFDHKTVPKMEIKLIITMLGLASYMYAIFLNIGTVKADILFFLAVLLGILRIVRYMIKTWQDYRKEEITIRKMQESEK